MDAMIAWMGIRPWAVSRPPERLAADANGAAQRFSQMSTPAVLPGSRAASLPSWLEAPDRIPDSLDGTTSLRSGGSPTGGSPAQAHGRIASAACGSAVSRMSLSG